MDRVDPPFGLVVAEGPMRHDVARWLLAESATTLVCVDTSTWMRLDPQALSQVSELRDQVRVGDRVDGEVYRVPGSESGAVTVRSHDSVTSSWRLVSGVRVWHVEAGERRQRLRSGRAEVVGWLPLLVCFHFLAVFGGRSRWVVGFPRRVGADFGEDREVLLRAFVPRPDPPTYADPSGPLGTLVHSRPSGAAGSWPRSTTWSAPRTASSRGTTWPGSTSCTVPGRPARGRGSASWWTAPRKVRRCSWPSPPPGRWPRFRATSCAAHAAPAAHHR